MKKIIAIAVCLAVLLGLAACGGSGGSSEKSGSKDEAGVVTAQFNGAEIKLKYETNHRDLFYKHNYQDLHSDTMGSFRQITYSPEGDVTLEILLVYYEGKSVEEVMSESDETLYDKTLYGLDYKYFEFDRNGVPGHTYVYCFDGTTYTISFVSPYDTTLFESAFMSTVRFEKSEE